MTSNLHIIFSSSNWRNTDSKYFNKMCLFVIIFCWLRLLGDSNHRVNGSSSPVLTATSLSYGTAKNSTPHKIKTPDLIEIKFGTVDYVSEMTPHAKFRVNPSKGGFLANGWNIRKIFCSHIPFFQKLTYRSDPSAEHCVQWLKPRGLAQGCAFWKIKIWN